MKYTPRQVSLPIFHGPAWEALRTLPRTLKHRLGDTKYVWFAAALLFGLNLAVVFSPTFAPKAETRSGVAVGPATAELNEALGQAGFTPLLATNINKDAFSVEGALIALAGDNIQAFEYPSSITAGREAAAVADALRLDALDARSWDDPVSLYNRGSLVVYYMGSNENILRALDALVGPALTGGASAFEAPPGGPERSGGA